MLKCFYYSNYDKDDRWTTLHYIIFAETRELALVEIKNKPVDFDPDYMEEIAITAGITFVDSSGC